MIKKRWLKRVGAFTLALSMILGSGVVNAEEKTGNPALVDPNAPVKLTIHKYEMEDLAGATIPGDGTTNVEIPQGAKPLQDVTFTVYKVAADSLSTEEPQDVEPAGTETTDANGLAVFDELEQGRYLVVETDYPDKVTKTTPNFLVDLPMVNPDGTGWNYDVHAYPKNETVLGAVVLTKTDGDSKKPLEGAKFKLQKKVDGEWTTVMETVAGVEKERIFETNAKGQITVNDLIAGEYQFVETTPPSGYGINTTPHTFTIAKNGVVDQSGNRTGTVVEVAAENMLTPDISKSADKTTASVGDTVKWTLTPSVPLDIAGYKEYEVTDTLDSRLTYKAGSLVVKLDGTELKDGFTADTTNGIKVTFEDFEILAEKVLTIEFETTVAKSAEDNPGHIANKGHISYENEYGTTGDKDSTEVKVYVGNIRIEKRAEKEDGAKLEGAEFALYPTEKDAKNGTSQIGSGVKTDKDGLAYIKGLAAGEYWLVETKAPTYTDDNGKQKAYVIMSQPLKVTVSENDQDATCSVTVVNKRQGFSIPLTGGAGTLILLFAGMMTVSGAVIVLILRRRRIA